MGNVSRVIGCGLMLYGLVCFLVNFGIWKPPFIGDLHFVWNPLDSLVTGRIVGDIPLLSGTLAWLLNYVFALVYSAVLGIMGFFMVLH